MRKRIGTVPGQKRDSWINLCEYLGNFFAYFFELEQISVIVNASFLNICAFFYVLLQNECHNYIRVAAKINNDVLYVCGTNAYKPLCQKYNVSQVSVIVNRGRKMEAKITTHNLLEFLLLNFRHFFSFCERNQIILVFLQDEPVAIETNIQGIGKCPFDPTHNSTAIFSSKFSYYSKICRVFCRQLPENNQSKVVLFIHVLQIVVGLCLQTNQVLKKKKVKIEF